MSQDQKIVKDERGQEQPAEKKRAQQTTAARDGAFNQDAKAPQSDNKGKVLSGEDKRQGSLRDTMGDSTEEMPVGLRRERTHPLNPTEGRGEK
jgi:hypothetical protein